MIEERRNEAADAAEAARTLPPGNSFLESFSQIFNTGFSEIKRKSAITRLNYEIRGLEREKEKHVMDLGGRAWEAHVEHPDVSMIVVNLKELQIEINRLKTQFGEHDTQIKDIDHSKTELSTKFNLDLDQLEQQIVPHRQKIETINAEKEDNKIQIEELRAKQDQLSQQIRVHQKNIQELDMGDDNEKDSRIELEKASIRNLYLEKSDIDTKIPFHMAKIEKLKVSLAQEKSEIEKLESDKEALKRDFEQRIKDYNHQIANLEERKKHATKQQEQFRREMEPFLFDLGKRVEQLRLQEAALKDNFAQIDSTQNVIEDRRKQISEAESLSRAMDRGAWTKFLVVSGGMIVVLIGVILSLFI